MIKLSAFISVIFIKYIKMYNILLSILNSFNVGIPKIVDF